MTSFRPMAALMALAILPVSAEAADDVAALRAELQAMKSEYSTRVDALESRIKQLETTADAQASLAAAEPPPPEPPAGGGGASAFNPAISLILGGSYTHTSRDPSTWSIGGFPPGGDEIGPGDRSFNLGESELTVSANIDPYFSGTLTASITGDNEIEAEEAFFRTTALPDGFTVKGGRFFSGFGYLNEVHAHAWDFVDQPLVYQALFGGQYKQNGVQVKWLAPTDLFVELGAEGGNGDGFPATRRARNGLNGVTLFAHVGGDVGDYGSWRFGGSWLDQHSEDRSEGEDGALVLLDSFTGDSRTWVADAVFKWAPSPRRQLKVQGEYMRRTENGVFTFDPTDIAALTNYRNEQSGWYLQSVYQFAARWRAGVRYDSLDSGRARYLAVDNDSLDFPPFFEALHPDRTSVMLDWNPSEFSRLRAQYDIDNARDDGEHDRIWRLQYIYGIGAHGAHKY
jgi:hypothetical protein